MRTAWVLLGSAVLSGMAGCGQKGPLFLPDKAGTVVTRPAGKQTETSPETAPPPATTKPSEESTPPAR